jgi:uncharacterized damage-inducible protein DinB
MVHAAFVDFSERKLRQLCERIETCLGELNEEQIWWRGAETQNAIGNLVLHLCGNLGQWIVSGVGGAPDTRYRDAEFAARGDVDKQELIRRLRERVEQASGVIGGVSEQRLLERVKPQHYEVTVLEAIYHVVEHFSQHTGQIIYATKLQTGADLGFYRHLANPSHSEGTP